jgi:hypothetical protein
MGLANNGEDGDTDVSIVLKKTQKTAIRTYTFREADKANNFGAWA